jgi:hypothetical protein
LKALTGAKQTPVSMAARSLPKPKDGRARALYEDLCCARGSVVRSGASSSPWPRFTRTPANALSRTPEQAPRPDEPQKSTLPDNTTRIQRGDTDRRHARQHRISAILALDPFLWLCVSDVTLHTPGEAVWIVPALAAAAALVALLLPRSSAEPTWVAMKT